jgi:hypothetical protein
VVQNGGFQSQRDFTLEAARSLLFIEVGEYRAVVMAQCVQRLQNREKCNRRRDICGNMGKRRYCSFEQVSVAPSTPLVKKGCVASKLPLATFGLGLLLGLSN